MNKEIYLVSLNDIDFNQMNGKVIEEDVIEFVVSSNEQETIIYRMSTVNGLTYYSCRKNIFDKNGDYETITYKISKEEFDECLTKSKESITKEKCYYFIENGEKYKLIVYLIENDNFAVLERNIVNANQKALPSFIKDARIINNNEEVFIKK